MIVLDTHAWVWWLSNPEKLSRSAREVIDRSVSTKRAFVSCISAWEIALLVAKGRLELTMDVADWIARSEALQSLSFVPVDSTIAVRAVRLPGTLHNDPADRIVVATAVCLGADLVTMDRRLRAYPHIRAIW